MEKIVKTEINILYVLGALSALLGLVEVTRLVFNYWTTYGLTHNFYLEAFVYVVGIFYIVFSLFKTLDSD